MLMLVDNKLQSTNFATYFFILVKLCTFSAQGTISTDLKSVLEYVRYNHSELDYQLFARLV